MKEITNKKELGKVLSEIKSKQQITYYKVMKESGLNVTTQKSIENGSTNYTIDLLLRFCKSIGAKVYIDVDELVK